jgi:hypothetical protein
MAYGLKRSLLRDIEFILINENDISNKNLMVLKNYFALSDNRLCVFLIYFPFQLFTFAVSWLLILGLKKGIFILK